MFFKFRNNLKLTENRGRYSYLHPERNKTLKEKREKLSAQQKAQHNAYTNFKNAQKDLQTICSNIDSILGQGRTLKQEQEQTIS